MQREKDLFMRVLFRTSGGKAKNKELGTGHIYRCLNLAENLHKQKKYFLIEDFGGVEKIIKKYPYKKLEPNIKLEDDVKKTVEFIEKKKIDVIVIDKFKVDKQFVKKIKKVIKTIVITDLKNIDYDANLLVNGFIGYKNKIIKNRHGTQCFLGSNFQILNKKYEKNVKKEKQNELLLTFGGFDENNIAESILKELQNNMNINIKLILGPTTKITEKLKRYEKSNKKIKIIQSTSNMQKEMSRAKFGLCSGGLTTYEFSSMGIPFGIICQNQHQLITAKQWQKKKNAINLGVINKKLTKEKMNKFVKWIDSQKYTREKIVDGKGGLRIAREICKILKE
jgi:UDP-2,4-diacetamido-2,4,6-trideoxy-beta-L-altropyranose hydrolase